MQNQNGNIPAPGRRPPRLRLPFEKRAGDPGEWSYDHRAGICITLIFFLSLAIAFMWWNIDTGRSAAAGMILVEFPDEIPPRDEDPQQRELEQIEDFSDIRNLASNQNAELNSQLRDAKGLNASEIYESAGALDDRLRANREAYEEGLKREQEILDDARRGNETGQTPVTARVEGRVTVSYSFSDPTRDAMNLVVPAYRCEGGGQVVVNATLDINGYVTGASVERSLSAGDDCMQSTALGAARSSRFNVDPSAPARHRGTITYIFIPQ